MSAHSRPRDSNPSTSSPRVQQPNISPAGMWADIPQVPADNYTSGYTLSVPEPAVSLRRSASGRSHPSPFSGSSPGLTFDSRTIISSVDGDEYDPGSWATDDRSHGQNSGLGFSTGHPWSRKSIDERRRFHVASIGGSSTGFYADSLYDDEAPEPDPAFGVDAVSATGEGDVQSYRKVQGSYGGEIRPMKLPQNDGKLKTMMRKVAKVVLPK